MLIDKKEYGQNRSMAGTEVSLELAEFLQEKISFDIFVTNGGHLPATMNRRQAKRKRIWTHHRV